MRLEGFALPYGVWTWHREERAFVCFATGSFTELIAHRLIRLNVHHQQHRTLADQQAGTLRVFERPDGIYFEADIPESPLATFVAHAIEHGIAINVCPTATSRGEVLETAPGAPRRIVQRQVFGSDFAILMAAKGHYPQTWVRVDKAGG